MKKVIGILLISIFTISVSLAADEVFRNADKNKDGKISKKEYREAVEKTFKAYDVNRDGLLTKDEIKEIKKIDADHLLKEGDLNKDSKISRKEFDQAAEKRFKLFDKNNDGYVDKKEWDRDLKKAHPNNPQTPTLAPFISVSF